MVNSGGATPIKRFVIRGLIGLAAAAIAGTAMAQAWPAKPLRWIVPYPPGGPADTIARVVQPRLGERLGQPVIIENRAGGNNNIGHEAAARSAPDGYTILYVTPSVVTNPPMFAGSVDPFKDLMPVAQMTAQAYLLLAYPGFGPKTVTEIIAAAKAKPGSVSCASGGALPTFGCEWLRAMSRTDIVQVRYKGNAPAMNDLIGGQVSLLIDLFNTALPQVRAGRARAVALTAPKRGAPLPELPVIAETLPGFVLVGWHGVMAPAGVPRPVVERLSRAVGEALADAEVKKRISDSFINVAYTSAEAFGEIMKQDYLKYARIIQEAGIKPE